VIAVQLVLFPLSPGLFVKGAILGGLTALIALGMALTYRSNRIVNFAQGDLGTAPVVLVLMLLTAWNWPYLVSLGVGLVAAVVLGVVVELAVIRRFFRAPRLLLTVATLGLAQMLAAAAILLPRLWGSDRLLAPRIEAPFDFDFTIGGGNGAVVFHANDLLALIITPLAIVVLSLLLRSSGVGIAVRASADDADRASLLGVPVKRLQTVVWATTALLAFVAVFLRAGVLGLPIDSTLSFDLLLRSLAALVLGGMTDLVAVTAAAVALGVLESGISYNVSRPQLTDVVFAAVIFVALFVVRQRGRRSNLDDTSTWLAIDDVRPVPAATARLPVVRLARWGGGGLVLLAAIALPSVLSVDRSLKASALLIYAVLGLSLVVLTGWAGQVSLGQIGFFAIGAAVGAKATGDWNLDLSLALVVAAVAGAGAAVVIGLPALRTRGLYLAVTTLACSVALTSWLLSDQYFGWVPSPNDRVLRPPLFGQLDLDSPTAIYEACLAVLLLLLVALRGVRHSRTGRALLALRDNERGAQSYGLDPTRLRLTAFAMSGGIAAVAGCLLVHHQQAYDPQLFDPFGNLTIFTMVIVGGVATPFGAVLGALYLQGTKWFLPSEWQLLASGAGVLLVLLILPFGLGGLLYRIRDRWLASLSTDAGGGP
jgi:branched-chain amino acid transport system permease protein